MNPLDEQVKASSAVPDDCCGLCDLTYFDIALDWLGKNWNNAKGLWRAMQELYEDGYEQYAKPLLWRMEKLRPDYPGLEEMRRAINDRIFWGKRVKATVAPKGNNIVKKKT
jgi:hypothetical protein